MIMALSGFIALPWVGLQCAIVAFSGFNALPWVGLQCVVVAFPGHIHLMFGWNNTAPISRAAADDDCKAIRKSYEE